MFETLMGKDFQFQTEYWEVLPDVLRAEVKSALQRAAWIELT